MTDHTYDPERALWVPGRRRFIFLGLGALGAAALGEEVYPHLKSILRSNVYGPRRMLNEKLFIHASNYLWLAS